MAEIKKVVIEAGGIRTSSMKNIRRKPMKDLKNTAPNLQITKCDNESFSQYEGDDKVVTSLELYDKLQAEKREPHVNVKSGIPGIDYACEAVRAGFKKAWQERDYAVIVAVADKIPNNVLEEDPKLLMWYDQAVTRMGGE